MADEYALVTYDCFHYALIRTEYINPSISHDVFVHFADTAEEDLLEHPATSHLANPGKCPSCECSDCDLFAILHSQLSTRQETLSEFYEALRRNYLLNGKRYFDIDPLIRARFAFDSRCTLINSQFSAESRKRTEDPFFEPFRDVERYIHFTESLKRRIEAERKSGVAFPEAERVAAAQMLNAALFQISKLTNVNRSMTESIILLKTAERANDKSYRAKQQAKRVAALAEYKDKKASKELEQSLIPDLEGQVLQDHVAAIRHEKVVASREYKIKYGKTIAEDPGEYRPMFAALSRMKKAWLERMKGFEALTL